MKWICCLFLTLTLAPGAFGQSNVVSNAPEILSGSIVSGDGILVSSARAVPAANVVPTGQISVNSNQMTISYDPKTGVPTLSIQDPMAWFPAKWRGPIAATVLALMIAGRVYTSYKASASVIQAVSSVFTGKSAAHAVEIAALKQTANETTTKVNAQSTAPSPLPFPPTASTSPSITKPI